MLLEGSTKAEILPVCPSLRKETGSLYVRLTNSSQNETRGGLLFRRGVSFTEGLEFRHVEIYTKNVLSLLKCRVFVNNTPGSLRWGLTSPVINNEIAHI
ncbi:hypothetical protein T265_06783 [Opisthorchis viverrini]|uniref:Uncharacterized protein n=1 Tax=Opisthorchis viverrini TaxID=6198 RepID=A0A075AD66_OPIVI|nr:hypothetical protein T265_06783 [Opisthorchis viverrini]KER25874.1 hypothetical protein T265_06783 [Opisthorchis viverrini]